jgi:hypothetical protein
MRHKIINTETKEVFNWTIEQILEEINRDRSEEWTPYDKSDWIEGLEEWTEYELYRELY